MRILANTKLSKGVLLVSFMACLLTAGRTWADQQFILHPGYIEGTVTIPNGQGGEHTVHQIQVSASGQDAEGNHYNASITSNNNQFSLVVEGGGWHYDVTITALYDNVVYNQVRWNKRVVVEPYQTVSLNLQTDSSIEGTISVSGETVTEITPYVHTSGVSRGHSQFGFYSMSRFNGSTYRLPVVGGDATLQVNSNNVRLTAPDPVGKPNLYDYVNLGREYTTIAADQQKTIDFSIIPGYIEGAVTVTGAVLSGNRGQIGARIFDQERQQYLYSTSWLLADGTYQLPVSPGADVRAYGSVSTDQGNQALIEKQLADQIGSGEILSCNWEVAFGGSISGDVAITGINLDYVKVYGYGPNGAFRTSTIYTPGEYHEYQWDGLVAGQWGIRVHVWDAESDGAIGITDRDEYWFDMETVDLLPGQQLEVDFTMNPGFIGGTILAEDSSSIADLFISQIYGIPTDGSSKGAWTRQWDYQREDEHYISHYDLFVEPGSWWTYWVQMVFRHTYSDLGYYCQSNLSIDERIPGFYPYQYNIPEVSVAEGQTVQHDLNYQTAQISARLRVATGEPLTDPRIDGFYLWNLDGVWDKSVTIRGSSTVSDVQEGLVLMHAVPGTYRLTAKATVQGSVTTFGPPFEITVDVGDVVITDPDAPAIVITSPGGSAQITDTCVEVTGYVTDDSEITSFTINGQDVPFDPVDGNFLTIVCGLSPGDNIITVNSCDEHGNCATIQRTVTLINSPPTADAGENIQVTSEDQTATVIMGSASDTDGDLLQYRWLYGEVVLLDWTDVGSNGEAYLNLDSLLDSFSIGDHTLALEVRDGLATSSDDMVLTIQNSPPEAMPAPIHATLEYGIDSIVLVGEVSDFDGDILTCDWLKDGQILTTQTITAVSGGDPVTLEDLVIPAGDGRFPVGTHSITLQVNDGINAPVSKSVTVDIIDSTAPVVSPIPNVTMLWPPNHLMHTVAIQANACDNSGDVVHLDVEIQSSEPDDGTGDGTTEPDYEIISVDDQTGIIELNLRAERAGKGDGRTYTITITATDVNGNQSVSVIEILAPHDRRKK
jgi:hypothetical protein